VCGSEKTMHYIPGALFYVDSTGEIFSNKRRRAIKPFFRSLRKIVGVDDCTHSLVVHMNLNNTRSIEICVAERSHTKEDALLTAFPSKMCSNHPPFVDNTGRRYTSLILEPGDVLVLDGNMIEYVKKNVPANGT